MTGSSTLSTDPPTAPLLSAEDVARVVDRIAHQLIEKAGPDLAALVGADDHRLPAAVGLVLHSLEREPLLVADGAEPGTEGP